LYKIHSDLTSPFFHPTIIKARYVLTFLDDYSRYTLVFFLKQKYEVFEHHKEFKALLETQLGRNIKFLCTNDGGEYVDRDV